MVEEILHFSSEDSGGGVASEDEFGHVEEDSEVIDHLTKLPFIFYGDCQNTIKGCDLANRCYGHNFCIIYVFTVDTFVLYFSLIDIEQNNFT